MLIRVRLRFASTPLHYAQKCWFTFDPDKCKLVGDVAHLIGSHFGLSQDATPYTHGIQLYMDDFLVPTNESAEVIRDNDVIQVKVVEAVNGLQESKSSSPSSPELPPSKKKRVTPPTKKAKVEKKKLTLTPKTATLEKKLKAPVANPNSSKKQTAKSKASKTKTQSKPASIAPTANKVKELRASQTNTASGGVHLTFHDSSSSSSFESSSSESSDSDASNNVATKPANNFVLQKTNKNAKQSKGTPSNVTMPVGSVPAQGKPRGRGGKSQSTRRSLPSNLVIGGPNDVHSTKSSFYNKSIARKETDNVCTDLITKPTTQPASVQSQLQSDTSEATTGWDIMPKELNDTMSNASKDYSALPALDGAPRIGDHLAFKLLELSTSCTPEISSYKEALVLAYDNSSKTIRIKYKELPGISASQETGATSRLAKFALEQETVDQSVTAISEEVDLNLDSLITPKLIDPS